MNKFEAPDNKNAFSMNRYTPFDLKYQLVIDVVDGEELGKGYQRTFTVWKVTKKNDYMNQIELLKLNYKRNDISLDERDNVADLIRTLNFVPEKPKMENNYD